MCPEQTLLRNYGRSSRRSVQDPRKARRLYSYLPWCNSKLYNLLPQPGCMQSKMLKATHHFTADIMSGFLVKKSPQNSQCTNLEVINALLVKRHQNQMQLPALHVLTDKPWLLLLDIDKIMVTFHTRRNFVPGQKNTFPPPQQMHLHYSTEHIHTFFKALKEGLG